MRSTVAALALALIVLGVSATAEARAVHYRSQHPLPRKIGHGFCYINVPHVHDFGPSDPLRSRSGTRRSRPGCWRGALARTR